MFYIIIFIVFIVCIFSITYTSSYYKKEIEKLKKEVNYRLNAIGRFGCASAIKNTETQLESSEIGSSLLKKL